MTAWLLGCKITMFGILGVFTILGILMLFIKLFGIISQKLPSKTTK